MNKNLKIVNYGFLVWLIPSLVSVTSTFFSGAMNIFEIISAVAIAVTVIVFSYLYLSSITVNFIKEGVLIGISWLIINIVLDLILIAAGISQLSLTSYVMYVAPLYIIIPAITIGLGLYMNRMNDANYGD
jgi:hypothetical protein